MICNISFAVAFLFSLIATDFYRNKKEKTRDQYVSAIFEICQKEWLNKKPHNLQILPEGAEVSLESGRFLIDIDECRIKEVVDSVRYEETEKSKELTEEFLSYIEDK
jgi:hypothetical protein